MMATVATTAATPIASVAQNCHGPPYSSSVPLRSNLLTGSDRIVVGVGDPTLDRVDLKEPAERGHVLSCSHFDGGDGSVVFGVLPRTAQPTPKSASPSTRSGTLSSATNVPIAHDVGSIGCPNGSYKLRAPCRTPDPSAVTMTSPCKFGNPHRCESSPTPAVAPRSRVRVTPPGNPTTHCCTTLFPSAIAPPARYRTVPFSAAVGELVTVRATMFPPEASNVYVIVVPSSNTAVFVTTKSKGRVDADAPASYPGT